RLAVQRLRILQEKKASLAKVARREIATLLENSKVETARIKTEGIISEDIYLELLELLELYCELLISRFGLLDLSQREPDPAVAEGVNAIVHAAPRTELKELHVLREMLMHKFGREYAIAVMENRDKCVCERVANKLTVAMPPPELVDAYLHEIAKAYGIGWAPPGFVDGDEESGGGGGGGLGVRVASHSCSAPLTDSFANRKQRQRSSLNHPSSLRRQLRRSQTMSRARNCLTCRPSRAKRHQRIWLQLRNARPRTTLRS
ncbi:DUF292-domain-containing protein, partial [Auricularia subglabra TFB-10046 SS5]